MASQQTAHDSGVRRRRWRLQLTDIAPHLALLWICRGRRIEAGESDREKDEGMTGGRGDGRRGSKEKRGTRTLAGFPKKKSPRDKNNYWSFLIVRMGPKWR